MKTIDRYQVLAVARWLCWVALIQDSMSLSMPTQLPTNRRGVLWDVDGTLVESTQLAFVATNEVR